MDFTPDTPDVLQEEPEAPAAFEQHPIAVAQQGPVRTQDLPSKASGYKTYDLNTTTAVKILGQDPRRRRAVLIVADKNGVSRGAALGGTQAQAQESVGANIPLYGTGISSSYSHPPVELLQSDEVWAIACGATCTVTVISEQWAY